MTVFVHTVRVGRRTDATRVAEPRPSLSWTTRTERGGWLQAGAEIQLDGETTATVAGRDSAGVAWPFPPLAPRSRHTVRVRVRGADRSSSQWSEPVSFWAGFLDPGEWTAGMIGLPSPEVHAQPALLRTDFDVRPGLRRATLYATAQGVYDVFVNGHDVDDEILKPGWTAYRDRLVHESTDVTGLVHIGANGIGILLAGGWYTERYGFGDEAVPFYGEQPGVAAQLVVEYDDGTTQTIVTGPQWRATAAGPLRASGIYAGEHYDARREVDGWAAAGFDTIGWSDACTRTSEVVPQARTSPAVRAHEELPVADTVVTASGEHILDFGQNLVGRLRIRVRGAAGTVLTLRHAEVLDGGELALRPLRNAEATDTYTVRGDGDEVWEPRFTFHGFRYAQITGEGASIAPEDVTAVVVHSDMRRTGWLETSDPLLNRLHENVVWGMKGNFLSLPTDCPQRDERLGWTGDIQVFAPTASYLYDTDGFLSSWLADLALEQQAAGGSVPFVVPNVLWDAAAPAAAWGDAATVVPSVLHERFADLDTLRAQLPSMRGWADRLLALAGDRHLWEGGFQFGDWLDPAAPPENPFLARTDHDVVASAYLYRSVALVAAAAETLGERGLASAYAARAQRVHAAFLAQYVTAAGRVISDTETAYALAIQFGLFTDEAQRQAMGDRLAELVRRDGYRIATGFVGTPLIADALTDTGHLNVAERLLFQTENPSWLYPVTMGATTIWERWDSMREDGTINPGEMTSFNHYALGAIADWLHRRVGGIAPAAPGYRSIRIAPAPLAALDSARAVLDSAHGRIVVGWTREDGSIRLTAEVPPNTTAQVHLPGGHEVVTVGSGSHEWTLPATPARPQPLTAQSSLAETIDTPEGFERVLAAIATVHPEYAQRFRARSRWAADTNLADALDAYPAAVGAAVRAVLE